MKTYSTIEFSLLPPYKIKEALRWCHTNFFEIKPETFKEGSLYRLFKVIPDHFYIQDLDAKVDKRIEVKLLEKF